MIHYFAYGSNMSSRRLRARLPAAVPRFRAILPGYTLAFHRSDAACASGKCNIVRTDDPADRVHGVVFLIAPGEQALLDRIEGQHGYIAESVRLAAGAGRMLKGLTYLAPAHDCPAAPFDWYLEHVLRGALEHGLPGTYVDQLRAIEVRTDSPERDHELGIYR